MSDPADTAFSCPTCSGKKLYVYRSKVAGRGLMIRLRRCDGCGLRVRTREYTEHVVRPGKAPATEPPGCPSAPLPGG